MNKFNIGDFVIGTLGTYGDIRFIPDDFRNHCYNKKFKVVGVSEYGAIRIIPINENMSGYVCQNKFNPDFFEKTSIYKIKLV